MPSTLTLHAASEIVLWGFFGGCTDALIFLLDPSRFLGAKGLILRNQTCVVLS